MDARLTPQLGIAAAIVLIALIIAIGPLTTGAGAHPIQVTELKVAGLAADRAIVPQDSALAPLASAYAAAPEANPFVLRDKLVQRAARIPFPPPPPLTAPEPAVLPLPFEEQP